MNLSELLDSFIGPSPRKNTTPVVPDIETPRWQSADEQGLADGAGGLLDEDGQMTFRVQDHGHAGIRTIHGLIDLGSDIAEDLIDWENKQLAESAEERLPEDLRRVLSPPPRPIYSLANILPARFFRTDTLNIPAGNAELTDNWTLISNRSDRMWIELVNQGANPLLLSFTDDPNVLTAGGFPAITLPAVSSTVTTTTVTPPAGTTPAQPAVPTSTTLVQNVNPYPVLVTLSAFTLTQVFVNGQQVGTTNAAYIVPSGQAISITYTVAGTWTWAAVTTTSTGTAPTTATPIPRRFQIGGKLYVYSVLGTTIDYVEAYGLRNFELDYVNP